MKTPNRMTHAFLGLAAIGFATASFIACGGGDIAGNEGFNTPSGSSAGGNGPGGSDTGAGGSLFGSMSNGTGGSMSGSGGGCAATGSKAQLLPVNLFIMLDKSGSMGQNNKWTDLTQALDSFFADPASAGLRVALRFFPDAGCDEVACDVAVCAQPLVDIGGLTVDPAPMDVQEGLLVQAVQSRSPGGNTPMSAALGGAELWAENYQTAHPTEKVAVLLATDGTPNGCDNNIANIAAIAQAANGQAGILTYAIGLQGSNQQQLDQIAQAGGTMQSFMIGLGNAEQDLVNALKTIQGSVVSCSFQMPTATQGMVDPTSVNVTYNAATIKQVTDKNACGANGGWYYDNPANPTSITLCPSTCAMVQADPKADIEIVVGCKTQIQ